MEFAGEDWLADVIAIGNLFALLRRDFFGCCQASFVKLAQRGFADRTHAIRSAVHSLGNYP